MVLCPYVQIFKIIYAASPSNAKHFVAEQRCVEPFEILRYRSLELTEFVPTGAPD
jgi:hypothetical protein